MLCSFLIFIVKLYKAATRGRIPCCRFIPTCSSYAIEALEKHGLFKGLGLSFTRILRCRVSFKKYGNCGYDPVQ
ncbi:MAG: membrane protein insertion efficiency factor YidD [Holosporales bacterium]|nr:membrane protein insertion efficiency factor YidD [Holosporales bacterium]